MPSGRHGRRPQGAGGAEDLGDAYLYCPAAAITALSGAAGCYQPGGGVRGWENSWAARDLGYRRTLVLRRRLLLRAVLGAVVAFVARPLRPL